MPTLAYLSMRNEPLLNAEWQAWAIIGVAIAGIIAVGIIIWKSRKI